jgi:replication factor C subunit 3/5
MDNTILPWVEKYRPDKLEDVVSHVETMDIIRNFIKNNKIPHMLFYGPPGTGKTSVIKSLAKELYKENYDTMTMEINASEERGIDIVRTKITQFACYKGINFSGDNMYKLVILDEADSMTIDAQASLRKIIEKYTTNLRFCLLCNYIKKINMAIQSRCVCIKFAPIPDVFILKKIREIINLEKINISNEGINAIINRSNGDMRKVLNILQSLSLFSNQEKTNPDNLFITEKYVNNFLNYPSKFNIKLIMKYVKKYELYECVEKVKKLVKDNSYSINDVITEIFYYIINNYDINEIYYMKIIKNLQELEYNISNSYDENINIYILISIFYL